MDLDIIKGKKVAELREIAAALKIAGAAAMKKSELVALLTKMHEDAQREAQQPAEAAPEKRRYSRKNAQHAPETAPAESVGELPAAEEAEAPAAGEDEKTVPKKRGRKKKLPGGNAETAPAASAAALPAPQPAAQCEPACAPQQEAAESCKNADAAQRTENQYPDRYETTGILDLAEGGFGFLRFDNFLTSDEDVYVSPTQIRRFNLKTGDEICGIVRHPGDSERFGAMLFVKTVNGDEPGSARRRKDFSSLTPIYPERRICLEKGSRALSMRLTDLIAPIGFGQRGLIVAPPKAGKTTLLKQIAQAIEAQDDIDAELIVLLIDERPEEVTDMQHSISGHVIYSTFDEQPAHHVKVAEMVLARAQRLVEHKKNVIILLDSITRLARAYNLVEPPSGRTLSGGLDPAALYKPKKFFGAARNIAEGGSITILATALVETGSRMDDMIFEEFKGTGNMELHLDRNLQEKRIFPAINLNRSGTRREDMLMSPQELEGVWMMRRALADWGVEEATERIVLEIAQTRSNELFLERFRKVRL